MERGRGTEAVDGEIHLHEAIIQHIQSFLSSKEAAQTSILAKSWYNAWATRPIVDLDQSYFQIRGGAYPNTLDTDEFFESSKKIMRRYKQSNLKIDSFRFCMENIEIDCFSLVNELIVDAMKLGAYDLNLEIMQEIKEFDLPREVLRSENLVRLSVSGCRIDLEAMGGKVGFPKLKSLSLRGVCIVGFSTMDIASNCPLIEELVLSGCTCICRVRISDPNSFDTTRMLPLGSVSEFEEHCLGSVVDAPIRPYDNLRSLYLWLIHIDRLLFSNMSKSFPCLKDLSLNQCMGFEMLEVYSPSLEFLSIAHMKVSCKFDLPSLRKFIFQGTILPSVSFEAASKEWESDISIIDMQRVISSHWFDMLKRFLMYLSFSKISLSLSCWFLTEMRFFIAKTSPCLLPKPEVENLNLSMGAPTSVCPLLLKGVFWTCRPKFVTLDLVTRFPFGKEGNFDMVKLLCKTLIEEESESCCIPSCHMSDMYGLEKVDVEVFEDSLAEWEPIPWKALVEASECPAKKIRFKLGWR